MKLAIALAALAACSSNKTAQQPEPDAPAPDAAFAEAPHGTPPQVMKGTGSSMAHPKVLPIFFTGDTSQTTIEQFLAQMAASPYWTTTTGEYGVGAITILPSVVSTDTPPATDVDLETWLGGLYPTPDPDTIYTVFLPDGAVLTEGGSKSCVAFGGYHSEIAAFSGPGGGGGSGSGSGSGMGSGSNMPPAGDGMIYALVPRCASPAGWQPLDETTVATSHELVEAATDPHPFTASGYTRIDPAHYVWGRTPGAELGDMCEYVETAPQPLDGGAFKVQRTWSNASAAAGHDPCVPALSDGYIAAAPDFTDADQVMVNSHGGMLTTQGLTINNGTSQMLELDVFSDIDTSDTVSVEAMDSATLLGGTSQLAYQMGSQTTGGNGAKLDLMITRTKAGTGRTSEFVIVTKRNGKIANLWWGLVAGM